MAAVQPVKLQSPHSSTTSPSKTSFRQHISVSGIAAKSILRRKSKKEIRSSIFAKHHSHPYCYTKGLCGKNRVTILAITRTNQPIHFRATGKRLLDYYFA
ncbi:hypothetical protein [Alistipes sp. ZOR0009]|uniref:hypothetical protein n=1 Tax=Alistipes sp. ZOR0009 TaxID=1339253 RepID=UPI0012E04C2C|nr:hypothetical protein [Alistipes sp. ZOR0009]